MRTVGYCLAIAASTLVAFPAAHSRDGMRQEERRFDIAGPSLDQALMQFTEQSGLQLLLPTVSAVQTPAPRVVGSYTSTAALDRLLSGTRLQYEFTNARTVAIRLVDAESSSPQGGGGSKENSGQRTPAQESAKGAAPGTDSPTGKAVPEILVKGSRIMNVDVSRTEEDVQPYTILTSKQIERSGATNVESFLRQQLSMNTASQSNSQIYSAAAGTTGSINLRGLGANETLILINGRRSASVTLSTGTVVQPDVNGIPLSAIERIEVLPSSGSAIYGGAAMGGVVNFVLKRDFRGGAVGYSFDNPTDGHAPIRTVNMNFGTSLWEGRTQFLLGGQYSDGDPVALGDRPDLFERGISRMVTNAPGFVYSSSLPFLGATTNIASSGTTNLVLDNGTPLNSLTTYVPAGAAPGTDLSAQLLSNAGKYNTNLSPGIGQYGLQSPFGSAARTKSLFTTLRQALYRDFQLFGEFSVNSNEGRMVYNPFSGTYPVSSTAPTNPFRQNVFVTFPLSGMYGINRSSESSTRSSTIGLIAPIRGGWSSEIDYTWSQNTFSMDYARADTVSLANAMNAGTVNPFVDTIAFPPDLSSFLAPETFSGRSTLNDLALRASGPLGTLPAGQPVLTIGLEHRKEGAKDALYSIEMPLRPTQSTKQMFFGHSQSTSSAYAEALVPLIAARNEIFGVRLLDLQLAVRSEHYTVYNGTAFAYLSPTSFQSLNPPQGVRAETRYTSTNPTIGFKYQPLRDWTLRVSYATAFLPPTSSQLLFNPTVCANCARIVDPQIGTSYLVNSTTGGNPDLNPQTAKSWNFGVLWEPQGNFLEGIRVNLENYRIKQPNFIVAPLPQQVVSEPGFAYRVTRNPTTGLITQINTSFVNATEYETAGWDLKIDYNKETQFGTFGLRAVGTAIQHDRRQFAVGTALLDYAGFPNDGGEAKRKASATLSWERQAWTLGWTATYYSQYGQQFSAGSPSAIRNPLRLNTYTAAQGSDHIPSQTVHDMYVAYAFDRAGGSGSLLSNVTLSAGVSNVFNTLPPVDVVRAPYYYSFYGDPRLRSFRIGITKEFGH